MPAERIAATFEILMPGRYSSVRILEVEKPQYTRGDCTQSVFAKSLLNLRTTHDSKSNIQYKLQYTDCTVHFKLYGETPQRLWQHSVVVMHSA